MMKNRSPTTTSSENGRGWIAMCRSKRWPSQYWWSDRLCYVFAKLLIWTCTVNNWTVWKKPSLANKKGIVFDQDNTRLKTEIEKRQQLHELRYEVFMQPPFSLARRFYNQFLFVANYFVWEKWPLMASMDSWCVISSEFPVSTTEKSRLDNTVAERWLWFERCSCWAKRLVTIMLECDVTFKSFGTRLVLNASPAPYPKH